MSQADDALGIAREILARVLYVPVESIEHGASISDIKPLDSLSFEALILELEEVSGRDVDPVSLIDLKTVKDLADLLKGLQDA